MKTILLASLLITSYSFAAAEVLYNTKSQKSVLDLKTDPNLKPWQNSTYLYELCYKNASASEALKEIMFFKQEELLFDFDTESYVSSEISGNEIIINALNGKMMDDGLTVEEATVEYIVSPCEF